MASILTYAEVQKGSIKKGAFEIASKAKELGADVSVCLIGSGIAGLAASLAQYGADKVFVVDAPDFANYNTEPFVQALAQVAAQVKPDVILTSATAQGKDLTPALAARLGVASVSDCVEFTLDGGKASAKRPVYAGKAIVSVTAEGSPQVFSIRPNALGIKEIAGAGAVENFAVSLDASKIKVAVKEVKLAASDMPDQTEAAIIVSGGRGMKDGANFEMLKELAKVLGPTATVGASRAAVDAGWVDHSYQVGQTGKTVSPNLYIAAGISGAIQHLAGMGTSKVIVAINKDCDAPIKQKADYFIEGDLFNVIPALTAEIKKIAG